MEKMGTAEAGASASIELQWEIVAWMNLEAELLDGLREREWLDRMVSRDVVYQVPIRTTVSRASGDGFVVGSYHLDENYSSLNMRVKRNETGFAWAEDPPSRIRHFVSNIRVRKPDVHGLVATKSNLLLFRTRMEQTNPTLFSGERHDLYERGANGWLLRKRVVYLDHTVIASHNFAMFF